MKRDMTCQNYIFDLRGGFEISVVDKTVFYYYKNTTRHKRMSPSFSSCAKACIGYTMMPCSMRSTVLFLLLTIFEHA